MNEDKKINEKNSLKTTSKNFIQKEFQKSILKLKNPGFNMVSLKARQRLNLFKQILSQYEYKDYIRKCKNMYSVSSAMNNHYSLKDLYLSERKKIPELVNLFNKIDAKLYPKKIFYKKVKKKETNDSFSLSASAFFKKNNSLKETSNKVDNMQSLNENKIILSYRRKSLKNKTIDFNRKSSDILIYRDNIKRKSLNIGHIKNIINDILPTPQNIKEENEDKDNNTKLIKDNNNKNISSLLEKKNNSSLKSIKSENINNISFSPLLPKFRIKRYNKKNYFDKTKKKKKSPNKYKDIKLKYCPLFDKNDYISIIHYGGIKYNNSIFRNKGIDNFLPNYYSLPLLYKNIN